MIGSCAAGLYKCSWEATGLYRLSPCKGIDKNEQDFFIFHDTGFSSSSPETRILCEMSVPGVVYK